MNSDLILGTRALEKGCMYRVAAALGRRVECLSGSLWVTQDGDGRDVVLEPGDGFEFDRPGVALLSALADSRYLMLQACKTARA